MIGTEQMSAVAIVNKLIFVYNLCLFGGCAGVGIFTAQFYGKNDYEGVKKSFRLKLYTTISLLALVQVILNLFGESLISLFLHEGGETGDLALTLQYAKQYLSVIVIGLIPQAFTECYSSTLRETEHTQLPMKAGICAIATNLILNYILIFGHFGVPALGVRGAAIATVISKFVELSVVAGFVHRRNSKYSFLHGVYKTLKVPAEFIKAVLPKSLPLLVNELGGLSELQLLLTAIHSKRSCGSCRLQHFFDNNRHFQCCDSCFRKRNCYYCRKPPRR